MDEIEEACETVGLEGQEQIKFSLFPNPATEKIHITFSQKHISGMKMEIININGEVVKTKSATSPFEVFEIADLSKGIYILRIRQHADTKSMYFVKQ